MKSFARVVRRSVPLAWLGNLFIRGVAPGLACVLVGSLVVTAVFGRWVWHQLYRHEVQANAGWQQAGEVCRIGEQSVEVEFQTDEPYLATGWWLEEGVNYHFRCTPVGWSDGDDLPADANGLIVDGPGVGPGPALQGLQSWLKRDMSQPIFKLMAGVGSGAREVQAIGADGRWVSPRSEQLYLFVNDVPGFYGNNRGRAKVIITRLD